MDVVASSARLRPFESLPDPRAHNILHPLPSLLLIAIMAIVCGAPDWQSVSQWARAKLKWLITFLDLPHGVPSHDTFCRLFVRLDPDAFERCFLQWTADLMQTSDGKLIAIDGKTLRRSFDTAHRKNAIHLVSAWCQQNHLVLGQLATEEKSNEITAIPKLLELLDLNNATVSIDAMGCQKNIAQKICDGGGDYLLAVKDNQKTLHEDVRFFLDDAIEQNFDGLKHVTCQIHRRRPRPPRTTTTLGQRGCRLAQTTRPRLAGSTRHRLRRVRAFGLRPGVADGAASLLHHQS